MPRKPQFNPLDPLGSLEKLFGVPIRSGETEIDRAVRKAVRELRMEWQKKLADEDRRLRNDFANRCDQLAALIESGKPWDPRELAKTIREFGNRVRSG